MILISFYPQTDTERRDGRDGHNNQRIFEEFSHIFQYTKSKKEVPQNMKPIVLQSRIAMKIIIIQLIAPMADHFKSFTIDLSKDSRVRPRFSSAQLQIR